MGTTLANLQINLGYHLGCTILSTSRWSTTQTAGLLNQALRKVVADLYAAKCWNLLHELEEEKEYTLDGSSSYNVYTTIGDSTNYQGFIGGRINQFKVREASIEEEDRTQNSHEYSPVPSAPWIIFFDYDSTSEHGNLPVYRIKPTATTGTFYFRYLKNAPTMASTPVNSPLPVMCDDAIVFLAAAYCWSGDRNGAEFSRFMGLHDEEMYGNPQKGKNGLIPQYENPVWKSVYNEPVT